MNEWVGNTRRYSSWLEKSSLMQTPLALRATPSVSTGPTMHEIHMRVSRSPYAASRGFTGCYPVAISRNRVLLEIRVWERRRVEDGG